MNRNHRLSLLIAFAMASPLGLVRAQTQSPSTIAAPTHAQVTMESREFLATLH